MDTLTKTLPTFHLKPYLPPELIPASELWAYLTLEQQRKVMQVLVITCHQIVQRLAEKQEEKNED